MPALSLPDLTRCLAELQATPNLFDPFAPDTGHRVVLRYGFEAFQATGTAPSTSTARFGAEVVRRCFPTVSPAPRSDEVRIRWPEDLDEWSGSGPDVLLTATRNGTAHHAGLIVSPSFPLAPDRIDKQVDTLSSLDGSPAAPPLKIYTTASHRRYSSPARSQILGPDAIQTAVITASNEAEPTWLIDEYRDWINHHRWKDTLLQKPAVQDWYFTGTLPADTAPLSTAPWPTPPTAQRRVHAHLLHRLAHTLVADDASLPPTPNAGRAPNGEHLHWASLDDGALLYRLHTVDPKQAALDLRLVAGPTRGQNRDDRAHWINLKKTLRARLRDALADAGLDDRVDTPGYRAYTFQKAAKDTSLCRVWLPTHDETDPPHRPIPPNQLADLFPALHATLAAPLTESAAFADHVEDWHLRAA